MDREERIRACYQHTCLLYVSGKRMSNTSLRTRLGIKDTNYPMASRIIRDTLDAGLINVIRKLPAPAAVNSSVAVVRPKENVNSLYLYYLIASDYMQKLIEKMKGGQGVPHLFQDDIRKFWIWIPPLAEQQAIAAPS